MIKAFLFKKAMEILGSEISNNSDFYSDAIEFNLRKNPRREYEQQIYIGDLPTAAKKQIDRLYKGWDSTSDIFKALNIVEGGFHKSPLEAKWVFEYLKKYNTREYLKENTLEDQEILRILSDSESLELNSLIC